jgi:hypothetical protein
LVKRKQDKLHFPHHALHWTQWLTLLPTTLGQLE